MPRKPEIPENVYDLMVAFDLRLRTATHEPPEVKARWFAEAKAQVGPRCAHFLWRIMEANIPLSPQVIQQFTGATTLEQKVNSGGANITQTAGRDMTGVNATGKQKIGDISVYTHNLDQAGAVISGDLRNALIESRWGIEAADIDDAIKPMLIEQFDKLTDELKKGAAKNPSAIKALWTVVYNTIKAIPSAATCYTGLDKLAGLLGL